jgi:hypothetical protein
MNQPNCLKSHLDFDMSSLALALRLLSLVVFAAAADESIALGSDGKANTFKGTIFAATYGGQVSAGAPNLAVSLSPPAKMNRPKRVASTNEQGQFAFENVEDGQYLLEVSQRLTVLYRELINIPQLREKEIRLNPSIDGLVSEIDASDAEARLQPTNALAFDKHYATVDVVAAILQRLETESIKPLSMQGEINALIILARRSGDRWTPDQLTRAKTILAAFQRKELTEAQRYAVSELSSALARASDPR